MYYRYAAVDTLTVPILDFRFWILDYFSVRARPLVGGTNLKDAPTSLTLRYRQSKIPKLHPLVGAVNPKSQI